MPLHHDRTTRRINGQIDDIVARERIRISIVHDTTPKMYTNTSAMLLLFLKINVNTYHTSMNQAVGAPGHRGQDGRLHNERQGLRGKPHQVSGVQSCFCRLVVLSLAERRSSEFPLLRFFHDKPARHHT